MDAPRIHLQERYTICDTEHTPDFALCHTFFRVLLRRATPENRSWRQKTEEIHTWLFVEDEDALVGPWKSDRLLSCGVGRRWSKKKTDRPKNTPTRTILTNTSNPHPHVCAHSVFVEDEDTLVGTWKSDRLFSCGLVRRRRKEVVRSVHNVPVPVLPEKRNQKLQNTFPCAKFEHILHKERCSVDFEWEHLETNDVFSTGVPVTVKQLLYTSCPLWWHVQFSSKICHETKWICRKKKQFSGGTRILNTNIPTPDH